MHYITFFLSITVALFAGQTTLWSEPFDLAVHGTTKLESANDYGTVEISANPNPFNPTTRIMFSPAQSFTNATIKIYSTDGRMVADLSKFIKENHESIVWNGAEYPSGLYVLRFSDSNRKFSIPLVLLK